MPALALTPDLYLPEVDKLKLERKIDFRLLPWLTLLYSLTEVV